MPHGLPAISLRSTSRRAVTGFALGARATIAHVSTGRRARLAISLAADLSQGEPTPWDHGPGRDVPIHTQGTMLRTHN